MINDKLKEIENTINSFYSFSIDELTTNRNSLVLFFYHELSWYYLTIAINIYSKNRTNKFDKNCNIRFGYRKDKSVFLIDKPNLYDKIKYFISKCAYRFSKGVILYTNISFTRMELLKILFSTGLLPTKSWNYTLNFTDFTNQLNILKDLISALDNLLGLSSNHTTDIILECQNILSGISKFPSKIFPFNSNKLNILLSGSCGNFINRTQVFAANHCGIKTIGILHSEEAGATKLKSWLYDDYALHDYILGYGNGGKENLVLSQKLFGHKPNYISSSSDQILSIKSKHYLKLNKSFPKQFVESRGLYIERRSRKCSGFINSDSFYYPDDYIQFRNKLLNSFPNLDVKIHPKGDFIDASIDPRRYIRGDLIEAVYDYDFILIDHSDSTAFVQVVATGIPIILLNQKNRKTNTSYGFDLIKKSTNFLDFELDSFNDTIQYLKKYKYDVCDNQFTDYFSLDSNLPRINSLIYELNYLLK